MADRASSAHWPTITPDHLLTYAPGDVWLDTTDNRWGQIAARGIRLSPSDIWIPSVSAHLLVLYRDGVTPMMRRLAGLVTETRVESGDVSVMSAELASEWAWPCTVDVLHLFIDPRLLRQVAHEACEREFDDVVLRDILKLRDDALIGLGNAVLREATVGDSCSRLYIEALSQQICVHLLRQYCDFTGKLVSRSGGLSERVCRRLKELMNDRLSEDLSLATLAAVASVSPCHFSRLFQTQFGRSPHQYVLELRLQRAQVLLHAKRESIAEIAAMTGFSDQSHLTRRFKQRFGITPAAARG